MLTVPYIRDNKETVLKGLRIKNFANPELIDQIRRELASVRRTAIGADEEQQQLASDQAVLGKLRSYLYLDRTMLWDETLLAKIQALTVEDMARVSKKYIRLDELSKLTAGDMSSVEGRARTAEAALDGLSLRDSKYRASSAYRQEMVRTHLPKVLAVAAERAAGGPIVLWGEGI